MGCHRDAVTKTEDTKDVNFEIKPGMIRFQIADTQVWINSPHISTAQMLGYGNFENLGLLSF